jgi:hypothetical protein
MGAEFWGRRLGLVDGLNGMVDGASLCKCVGTGESRQEAKKRENGAERRWLAFCTANERTKASMSKMRMGGEQKGGRRKDKKMRFE